MLVLGATFGELEAFVQNEKEVKLVWTTITERDNDYFLIQRSRNGLDFETIGLVDGNGTTEWEMNYDYRAHLGPYRCTGSTYFATGVNIRIHTDTNPDKLDALFEIMNEIVDGDDPAAGVGCGKLRVGGPSGSMYYKISDSLSSY